MVELLWILVWELDLVCYGYQELPLLEPNPELNHESRDWNQQVTREKTQTVFAELDSQVQEVVSCPIRIHESELIWVFWSLEL